MALDAVGLKSATLAGVWLRDTAIAHRITEGDLRAPPLWVFRLPLRADPFTQCHAMRFTRTLTVVFTDTPDVLDTVFSHIVAGAVLAFPENTSRHP